MLIIYFVLSRVFLFLCSSIAQKTVPYLGFFPYKELLVEYNLPPWVSAFANFDGIHYLLIAQQGYSQWEQAFFPLYPLLIKIVSFIIPNYLVVALLISNICFAIGVLIFHTYLKMISVETSHRDISTHASWSLLFLLTFPTAFFFGVVYTEGLFFMLFILSLYFLHKKNYWLAGICAALSSFTRLIGIFLIIPFFFHLIAEKQIDFKNLKFKIKNYIFLLVSPLLGLLSYMSYLWITTGDPLFFFNSQPLFGANRSTHLILLPQVYYRYIKILFTANNDFQWYLSLFEMSVFTFVFVVLILDLIKIIKNYMLSLRANHNTAKQSQQSSRLPRRFAPRNDSSTCILLSLNIFSFTNLLLPTLTGTFSSIPRYSLFSLSFFLYLSQLQSKRIKVGLAVVFITLQIVLLSLFIQGYFVG